MNTFYWYDYETFGLNPKTSRIAQFAGLRTDEDLNIIGEPLELYCKPTNDTLPSPESCLITGITPQLCEKKGIIEHQFIKKIHQEFSQPNTCIVGYNNIRFDDEFTRYTLYRNMIEPYGWHWKNGNSRWDILDMIRMCYALKKEDSLNWVYDDEGVPIFKLDQLAPANGIEHSNAHDAVADVIATIELAKIIKQKQPQLFAHAFKLKDKKVVAKNITLFEPILHTSGMYGNKNSNTRLCTPIAFNPKLQDRVIVFNLEQNPQIILDLSVDEIHKRQYAKKEENLERVAIKELIFNKSPMFVPNIYKLNSKICEQLDIDFAQNIKHLEFIKQNQQQIQQKIIEVYKKENDFEQIDDVDQKLYDGFISNNDNKILEEIQILNKEQLKNYQPYFSDGRLSTLFFHFKARNYPEILDNQESELWFEIVQERLQNGKDNYLTFDTFFHTIEKLKQKSQDLKLLKSLESYVEKMI
ncbi:Exodeoxyribonuclease I [hydrothermal vent metagenome]|uniref:Exodeoxyribonuclease I n=1 Tax=hydrothermal vent metagenome TaxID=652676 RepID=A0A1W1CMC4_9ZZZZ